MIGYLRGKAAVISDDYAIIDVNGVGYRVFVTTSARARIRLNEEIALFIHTSVREDAIVLYGFFEEAEYNAFLLLTSVSGIGPKSALTALSSITVEGLYRAIQNRETGALTKLSGIGKKTAERIILELKDKVTYESDSPQTNEPVEIETAGDVLGEAKSALVALGYNAGEIAPALKKIKSKDSVESIIKEALKSLNKF